MKSISKIFQEGLFFHNKGKFQKAENKYRSILKFKPDHYDTLYNIGILKIRLNDLDSALPFLKQAIKTNPNIEKFWVSYIDTLIKKNYLKEAIEVYEKAKIQGFSSYQFQHIKQYLQNVVTPQSPKNFELKKFLELFDNEQYEEAEKLAKKITKEYPNHQLSLQILSSILMKLEKFEEALTIFQKLIEIDPKDFEVYINLGVIFHNLNDIENAENCFNKAIDLNKKSVDAHNKYADFLLKLNRNDEAIVSYETSIKLKNGTPEVYYNLANSYKGLSQFEKAETYYKEAIKIKINFAEAYYNLGNVYHSMGQYEEARFNYKNAIKLKLVFPELCYNLGNVCKELKYFDEAELNYEKAIDLDKKYVLAFNNLGTIQKRTGKFKCAERTFKELLLLDKSNALANFNLSTVHEEFSRFEDAFKGYKKAINLDPTNHDFHNNKNLCLNYSSNWSPSFVYKEHIKFEEKFGGLDVRTDLNFSQYNHSGKKLRIGYVSGDFKNHSVSYFFEPLLYNHNKNAVEIFCYYNNTITDDTTNRLILMADHWRSIFGISDIDVVSLIKKDKIDILVDLSGHTSHNRLLVFARKPAPVQVSWLGYPNTTGLSSIDYRFTDIIADPVGEADKVHTETLYRLPNGFQCYKGNETAIISQELPQKRKGYVTFGSFNNLSKMTPEVIKVWSRILKSVPKSKLLLKSSQFNQDPSNYINSFDKEGVDIGRIKISEKILSVQDHLELYNEVDIGLDTFLFNGATTTCEALWMGVPVITLLGDRHVGRVGASILTNIGLTDFIAKDIDKYVAIATDMARRPEYLQEIREGLRQTMLKSPLCDGGSFAKDLENAFKKMWDKYLFVSKNLNLPLKLEKSMDIEICQDKIHSLNKSPTKINQDKLLEYYYAKRYDIAEKLAISMTEQFPQHNFSWKILGMTMVESGRFNDALKANEKALSICEKDPEIYNNLGTTHKLLGNHKSAIENFNKAISLKPDFVDPYNNIGVMYKGYGLFQKAELFLKKAITIKPQFAYSHSNLGNVLKGLGRIFDAYKCFNQAINLDPTNHDFHNNKNLCLNYSSNWSPSFVYKEHIKFEEKFGGLDVRTDLNFSQYNHSGKKLRIGYVSGDFKNHSVSYFFEPLLYNHNKNAVEIFCYYNNTITDDTTNRLILMADHWRSIFGISDIDVVSLIKKDKIDILVDLSGHTSHNRLLVFARKPAPVQVSWLGYPNTTGLSSIDYRFTDIIADPVGEADKVHTETLYRLPNGFQCYKGNETAIISQELPQKRKGYVTFGSFNNLSKMTPEVIKVWSRILKSVPKSKLLLKSSQFNQDPSNYINSFDKEGVDIGRIKISEKILSVQDHLELYNEVDIGLDTFLFNGATTTCEALWMGVPVITLLGDRHVGRVGASILTNIGLTDFIAKDIDKYVAIATDMARRPEYLQEIREGLRQTMLKSPLCDGGSFAKDLENAFKKMWIKFK